MSSPMVGQLTESPAARPLLALPSLAGCATTGAMRAGQNAEQAQDYDRAVVEYTRALQENPDNRDARLALDRAKLRAAQEHFARGRRLSNAGRLDEALVELQLAAELNPGSGDIDQELLQRPQRSCAPRWPWPARARPQLETLIERSRDLQPPGFDLPADARLPASLTFRDASARDIYTALAGSPMSTSSSIRSSATSRSRSTCETHARRRAAVGVDGHAQLLPRHRAAHDHRHPRHAGQAPRVRGRDRPDVLPEQRRRQGNARPAAHRDRQPALAPITATNAISIKDTPERVAAAARLIAAIDKARPEVVIDVELLEVDRTRLREYGLQLASPGTRPGIDGAGRRQPRRPRRCATCGTSRSRTSS